AASSRRLTKFSTESLPERSFHRFVIPSPRPMRARDLLFRSRSRVWVPRPLRFSKGAGLDFNRNHSHPIISTKCHPEPEPFCGVRNPLFRFTQPLLNISRRPGTFYDRPALL